MFECRNLPSRLHRTLLVLVPKCFLLNWFRCSSLNKENRFWFFTKPQKMVRKCQKLLFQQHENWGPVCHVPEGISKNQSKVLILELKAPQKLFVRFALWWHLQEVNFWLFFKKDWKNKIFVAFPKSQTCCNSVNFHV